MARNRRLFDRKSAGVLLQGCRTDAFHFQQLFHALEWAMLLPMRNDGLGLLQTDTFHAFGQFLGRGSIQVQAGFDLAFLNSCFDRFGGCWRIGHRRGNKGNQGKACSSDQGTHDDFSIFHWVGRFFVPLAHAALNFLGTTCHPGTERRIGVPVRVRQSDLQRFSNFSQGIGRIGKQRLATLVTGCASEVTEGARAVISSTPLPSPAPSHHGKGTRKRARSRSGQRGGDVLERFGRIGRASDGPADH